MQDKKSETKTEMR